MSFPCSVVRDGASPQPAAPFRIYGSRHSPTQEAAFHANEIVVSRMHMRTAAPALPPSNSPTREYHQHHDVEAPEISDREFRPGWRKKTRLHALVARGRLDRDEIEAALLWRGWVEIVGRVKTQHFTGRIDQAPQPGTRTLRELQAARALKNASAAIGARRTQLLTALLVDDLPWTVMAKKFRCHQQTVVDRCVRALQALASWTTGEGSRRARPARSRRDLVAVEKIDQAS
jgi:hypothetical protein